MDEVLDSYNPLGKYKINVYNLEGTHTDTNSLAILGRGRQEPPLCVKNGTPNHVGGHFLPATPGSHF